MEVNNNSSAYITASTTFSTSFLSRYRMEGTSIALPAVGSVVARTATSGQRVPIQAPTLGTCSSAAPTSTQSTTSIRRTVFRFVASLVRLIPELILILTITTTLTLTLVLKNFGLSGHSNRQPHQQPSPPVSFLATVWRERQSHYRRLEQS